MWTILTLNLSESNPFAQSPPPPPSLEEEDLMDIDLPEDFIFWAPDEDSDRESHHSPIPTPSPAAEAVEEVHSSSEEVVFTNWCEQGFEDESSWINFIPCNFPFS